MDLVEAAASSRAICRECASSIRLGEPRFGHSVLTDEGRRVRWRHLACAAQAMPRALRRALELDEWRSVPAADRDELRELIERALTRPMREDSALSELSAGRSSSAMAAAAVLEPAHDADELEPERARAWVLADTLQARGDPRGEQLALELAVEHTDDPAAARALQRELHGCRQRTPPSVAASRQLRLRWIGGFLRGAFPQARAQLQALLAADEAQTLERLRLDFAPQDELAAMVERVVERGVPLDAVELRHARHRRLDPLTALDGLTRLRVGDHFSGACLRALPQLRALSLRGRVELGPRGLDADELDELELRDLDVPDASLLAGLSQRLPRLRRLHVRGQLEPGSIASLLDGLRGATSLRTLALAELPVRDLSPLLALPELRCLDLTPAQLDAVDELAALDGLTHLALRGSKVGELGPLRALERCRHLALLGTRTTGLARLRRLPRLRSLALEGGDMHRTTGLERLTKLEQLSLTHVANLDLDQLTALERLDTLVLRPGGARPWQLERLAQLPVLRRLRAPLQLLERAKPRARGRALAGIEVLALDGSGLPSRGLLRALPRLRRIILPGRDPVELARFAEANPELGVFGELPPRDVLDRIDRFDWRALGWLPPGHT